MKNRMKGMSLFSSAGIGEYFLSKAGIDIVVSNELLPKRAELYQKIYPDHIMVTGDIADEKIFKKIQNIAIAEKVDFLIASPPCQGISVAGKNRNIENMAIDDRNYLIMYVIEIIDKIKPTYILIENVPLLLKLQLFINNKLCSLKDILEEKFSKQYHIHFDVLDAANYGTAQTRKRAIIRLHKLGNSWRLPKETKQKVTVADAIGDLPSIESGQKSQLK